jgi:hypothetical protein
MPVSLQAKIKRDCRAAVPEIDRRRHVAHGDDKYGYGEIAEQSVPTVVRFHEPSLGRM